MRWLTHRRNFHDLSEKEILALAISSEEDDARIYRGYAERLRAEYPGSAAVFDGMAAEEDTHRARLIDLFRARFGEVIPLIRREHVAGFYTRRPTWLVENLSLERIRGEAAQMEKDAERGELRWFPKKRELELHLSPDAMPLFGEVAEARLNSLASSLNAQVKVKKRRQSRS